VLALMPMLPVTDLGITDLIRRLNAKDVSPDEAVNLIHDLEKRRRQAKVTRVTRSRFDTG